MVFYFESNNFCTVACKTEDDKLSAELKNVNCPQFLSFAECSVGDVPFPYHPLVTEADVGPEQTGEVSADLRPSFPMFLVRSDMTGILEPVVEKFTDPGVFNALRVGTRVKFRVTIRLPRVVSLSII